MLGNRIKELRISHSLNQVEFAKELSVAKQTVSNWENNNIQPSIDMLVKIADFFNVSTDYLLNRDSKKQLDVSCLTDNQIAHINWIINDIAKTETTFENQ